MGQQYATAANMDNRFGATEMNQLTTGQGLDLAQAIKDASSKIDSYIRNQYVLPFSAVPDELINIACDIARYFLYDNQSPEEVRKRYEDAIRWLTLVSKGAVSLSVTDISEGQAGGMVVESRKKVFTDSLSDKMIDPLSDLGL